MKTLGVITMSGDPITKGHLWLLKEALRVFTHVDIVICNNVQKKHMFDLLTRRRLAEESITEYFFNCVENLRDITTRVNVKVQEREEFICVDLDDMYAYGYDTVSFVRGIRDGADMSYEQQYININRRVSPMVSMVYLIPPIEIQDISSSTVKSLYRLRSWNVVANDMVMPCVIQALKEIQ